MTTDVIYNEDCIKGLKRLPDASVDAILTDPPYKYLKNQKLEVDFDEATFFDEVVRVLKKDGFIVCFGRGTSFYRWNTMMADRGLTFKEEVVWDKCHTSSPLFSLMRVHETASIHTKGNGTIIKTKVPYLEFRQHDTDKLVSDIKRLRGVLNNPRELEEVQKYLESGAVDYNLPLVSKHGVTRSSEIGAQSRYVGVACSMREGMVEQSIIKERRDHYKTVHPTQKPVRLFERLLNLVCGEGAIVLDPFIGSGTTALACLNTNRHYIGFEIDKGYHEACLERIHEAKQQQMGKLPF